tara:strand:+ start:626 stop:1159 length:534 start_codon:yes stop_codon:yes gene_type:complete
MKDKLFYLIFFVLVLGISRIIPHPPNFTPILASAIMAPMLIKDKYYGLAIPILAMFIGDIIIGFHPYQFVIYTTILTISLLSPMQRNFKMLGLMAVGSSLWFFITTNFAVWIMWDYYPKTIDGLITCYTLAIPFFKNTLISTCIFTGLIAISMSYLDQVNKKLNYYFLNFSFRSNKS